MTSDIPRRIREATWFLGAIAATIGAGSILYLISVPMSFVWGCIASALGGFFFCMWLFRSSIFWDYYHEAELEWAEEASEQYEPEPETYNYSSDTILRLMRQPYLDGFPVECGVKLLDGTDSEPVPSTSFKSAVEDAVRLWSRLGFEFSVDVKVRDRSGVRR